MLGSPGKRRRASDQADALSRVRELAALAEANAPEPAYLDRQPRPSSASAQPLITERQREKVVKYINELAEDFELCVQTGTLACNYFDRYAATLTSASQTPSADKRFVQMIASTCLLIAAKFSDRKLPPLSELVKVHHGKVSADEFATLELQILQALRWKLHVPLPHAFIDHLRALCPASPYNATIEDRMLFFIDLSVYGYHFLAYSHAAIAAAAILVAWKFSEEGDAAKRYLPTLARSVGLEPPKLTSCVNALVGYYQSCFPDAPERPDQVACPNIFAPIDPNNPKGASPISASPTEETELPSNAPSPRPPSSIPPTPTEDCPAGFDGASSAPSKQPQHQVQEHERRTPDSVLEIGRVA